jgi:glycosyltransferase involved in cell wall biosynthesis
MSEVIGSRITESLDTDSTVETLSRPLSILHVTKSLRQGGIETMVHHIARELNNGGHDNTVLTFAEEPQFISPFLLRDNISLVNVGLDPPRDQDDPGRSIISKNLVTDAGADVPYRKAIANSIKEVEPDIVVSWHAKTHLLCTAMEPYVDKVPPVVWTIGGVSQEQYLFSEEATAFRQQSSLPSRVIYCGEIVKDVCLENGMCPENAVAIPYGIDTDLFRFSPAGRKKIREELEIDADAEVVVFPARYVPMKDVPTFIDAATKLLDERDSCQVIMCGRGMDTGNAELVELIADRMHRFSLLGVRDDMPDVLSASDVLANTSTFGEGLSVAMLEAMSCGCVPVVTDVGDAKLVVDGVGILTKMGDSDRIKVDLGSALDMSEKAPRSRVIERYGLQVMAACFAKEFESILSQEHAPSYPSSV